MEQKVERQQLWNCIAISFLSKLFPAFSQIYVTPELSTLVLLFSLKYLVKENRQWGKPRPPTEYITTKGGPLFFFCWSYKIAWRSAMQPKKSYYINKTTSISDFFFDMRTSFKMVKFVLDTAAYMHSLIYISSTVYYTGLQYKSFCILRLNLISKLTSIPSLFSAYSSKLRMAVLIVRGGGKTVNPMFMALLRFESRTIISCRLPSTTVF